MEPPYILNVDDNEAMRYARTRILECAGYRVVEASTGSEALTLTRRPSSPLWHAGKSFDSLGALGIDPSKEAFKVLDRASRLRPQGSLELDRFFGATVTGPRTNTS